MGSGASATETTGVTLFLNRDGKEEHKEFESLNDYRILDWLGIRDSNTFRKNFQLKAKKKPKNTYEVVPKPMTLRVEYGQTAKEVRVEEVMRLSQLKRRVAELFQLPDLDQLRLYEHNLPLPDDDSLVQNLEDVTITAQVDRRVTLHIQLNGKTINSQFWLSETWKTVRQEVAIIVNGQYEYVLLARNNQVIDRTSIQTLKDAGVKDNDTVVAAYRPSVKCIFSIEQESGELLEESVTLKPWDTVKRAKEVLIDRLKLGDQNSTADLTFVCAGSILEDEMVLEDLLEDGDTLAIAVNIERDSCVFIQSMRGSPVLD